MRSSGFERRNPPFTRPEPAALSGLAPVRRAGSGSEEDFCYILELSRVVGDADGAIREGIGGPAERTGGESRFLCPWETFVCRSYEKAKELMMDSDLLATDWIRCHGASDDDGRVLEVFLSTGGKFLARISRTELF